METIRVMRPEDLPAVCAIEKETFSQPWSENGFLSSLNSPDTLYLSAFREEELIAYCGLLQSFDEADITNVAVREDCRGQGVGGRMLARLMELGRQRGIERFTLEVRAGNEPALRLYKQLGFASVGVRKNFYEKPAEDAVIMWKEKE